MGNISPSSGKVECRLKVCSEKSNKPNNSQENKDRLYKKISALLSTIGYEASPRGVVRFTSAEEACFTSGKVLSFLHDLVHLSLLYIKKAYPLGSFGLCSRQLCELALTQGYWELQIEQPKQPWADYSKVFLSFKGALLSSIARTEDSYRFTSLRYLIPYDVLGDGVSQERLKQKYLKGVQESGKRPVFDTANMAQEDILVLLSLLRTQRVSVIGVKGDNLPFLKKVSSKFKEKVDFIYIDPPYNTGSRSFAYEDDVASYTWVNGIANRLSCFKDLLKPTGSLWMSIDDSECHRLKVVGESVFGWKNFVSDIIWEKKYTRSNDTQWFSQTHEHLVVYAKDKPNYRPNRLERTSEQLKKYANPDNDPRGPWKSTPIHARSGSNKQFSYTFKSGRVWAPPPGTFPRFSAQTMQKMEEEDRFWFGKNGKGVPRKKSFLSEVNQGVVSTTLWGYDEVGHTHEASSELKSIFPQNPFLSPKPLRLMERVFQLNKKKGCFSMDCYAGSGTTGIATLIENSFRGDHEQSCCLLVESGSYFDDILVARHRHALESISGVQRGRERVEIKPQIVLFVEFSQRKVSEKQTDLDRAFQMCLEGGQDVFNTDSVLAVLTERHGQKRA